MKYALDLFFALGGAAMACGMAMSFVLANEDKFLHDMLERAFKNPKLRAVLMDLRPKIEEFFDKADADIKAGLDAEADKK